ncbi:hypothetical protein ABT030_52385 [Streptomyces mirabilis]|uniref:hypothetical protein n=1 Tax=Streptomyces mirabilis TaxID=68239 RepID=UPI00332AEA72
MHSWAIAVEPGRRAADEDGALPGHAPVDARETVPVPRRGWERHVLPLGEDADAQSSDTAQPRPVVRHGAAAARATVSSFISRPCRPSHRRWRCKDTVCVDGALVATRDRSIVASGVPVAENARKPVITPGKDQGKRPSGRHRLPHPRRGREHPRHGLSPDVRKPSW